MIKKVVIGFLLLLFALMGGAFYAIPYFIDGEAIKTQLADSFKALTGLDLEIQGDAVVERFPTPHVVVNSLYVHNAQSGTAQFLLTVKLVKIWPSYKSLMRKRMTVSKIDIDDVDVELETLKNGQMNWKDPSVQTSMPTDVSKLSADENSGLIGTYITMTNGYVHYADQTNNSSSEYKDISLTFLNGGAHSESTLHLGVTYRDKILAIAGKIGSIPHALSVGEVPANLSITSGQSAMNYDGNAGFRDGKLFINGNVKFTTDDIVSWISTIMGNTDKPQPGVTYKPLPLEAKSDITSDNGKIIFPNMTLEGAIIKGTAHLALDPPYGIDVTAKIGLLDLETLFASKLFALKEVADPLKEALSTKDNTSFIIAPKSFYNSLKLSADLNFDDTLYNQQHIKDSHVQFDMENGEMTISQAVANLPGDSKFIFTGIGKEGYQGFALEGEVDASGANFADAVKVLKTNGAAYPVEDFKRFRIKANTVLSSKELRMSEMAVRIENMAFLGGFIATFGDRVKLEAALRVGGMNLDHFIQIWGIQEWRTSLSDRTPGARYDSFLARWLRRLDYDTAMNVSLENFTLNGHEREKADFRLTATSGKVTLDDVKTSYNGTQLSGGFLLDVMGALPKIEMKLTADVMDMDTFFTPDGKPAAAAVQTAAATSVPPPATQGGAPHWSHKEFDFHWLELLNVTFHFKFGQFKMGMLKAQSLDILGDVENRTLTIEALTGYVMGAQVAGKANIVGGKIPAINIAANVTSLDPIQLLTVFPILQGMTGKYNLSLRLDMSGIDMYSWVSSLEGSIGLGGENIDIRGFDMPGVIRTVSYVRTVADILNAVRRAFPGGDTLFSNIEGQWSVAAGVLKTSNSRLSNDQADGVLACQIDLINWQVQATINLALKALDNVHPPGMIISFNGNLDKPEVALDTRSLEEYVTNKTSERMLHGYGQ